MDTLTLSLLLSVVDKATAPLRVVGKAMDAVGKAGEGLKKAGESMRIARENIDDFTGRMKAGLESVLAPFQEVEGAMAKLATDSGPAMSNVAATLDKVRDSALEWSKAHTNSAATYITTTNALMKAQLGEAATIKATETALRVATGTSKDAAAIGDTLALVYKQLGDKSKDAGAEFARLGDILTRAHQTFAGIDIAALSDPLKDALPAAKAAKVSVEQVVAVLGQLNAAGIKGGEAGAGFAAVLESMGAASKTLGFSIAKTADGNTDLVGTLAAIEKKFGSLKNMSPEMAAKLQAAFGPAAFKVVAGLSGQTAELSANLKKVSDSAGAAAAAQATMEGTTAGQMQIAQQQVDALKLELAGALVPALQAVLPYVKDVVTAVSGFAKEHPGLVSIVGSLGVLAVAAGTVLGPLLSIGGAMASVGGFLLSGAASAITFASTFLATAIPALISGAASAWAFAAAMLANPITWIVLAIIALVAVIYIYWEPISGFFLKLWAVIKDAFASAWNAIKGAWDSVVGFFNGIWSEIKGAFHESFVGGVLTVLKNLNPLYWIVKAFIAIGPWLVGLWKTILSATWDALVALPGIMMSVGKWLLDAAIAGFGMLLKWYATFWSGVWSVFKAGVSWIVDGVVAQFSALWGMVTGIFSFFWGGIQSDFGRVTGFFGGLWTTVTGLVSGGVDAVMGVLASFNPLTMIMNGFNSVQQWLSSFSLLDAGRNIVNTIVDGITAAANGPAEAMQGIVQKVRNLLPFSPAKDGPLRDLHKVKLVQTVADSVDGAPLVAAMTGVAGDAMSAISQAPMPTFASAPPSQRNPASAGGATIGGSTAPAAITVNFNLNGANADIIPQLEAWMRDPSNASRFHAAVTSAAERQQAKELG